MYWPFVTTVAFDSQDGGVSRLEYAVSAVSSSDAAAELQRRFLNNELFGYRIESVIAATGEQERSLNLPPRCITLIG
jgi:hypothetical protein